MANCLVLGADGFIGSHLVDSLVACGHKVRAFSRFKGGESFNLEHLRGEVDFVAGDFLNHSDLEGVLSDIEYVFHMVSLSTPASTMKDPRFDVEANVCGTMDLLELCVKHRVKKVVFPSSGGTVYGNVDSELIAEDAMTDPVCPYGISKLMIEKYLRYFSDLYGLDYLIFRISNPYGERQRLVGNQGVIPIFLNLVKNNDPITVFGDGSMVRDYIYVKDVVDFMTRVFELDTRERIYNLGSGVGTTINDLIAVIGRIISRDVDVEFTELRTSDIQRSVLDISRVREEFGFSPLVDIDSGICRTWEYVAKK